VEAAANRVTDIVKRDVNVAGISLVGASSSGGKSSRRWPDRYRSTLLDISTWLHWGGLINRDGFDLSDLDTTGIRSGHRMRDPRLISSVWH